MSSASPSPGYDPLELYAAAIDTSDYAQNLAPVVRALVPQIGSLLDIGAGGGQLGGALRTAGHAWSAVEPSSTMRRRLDRLSPPPRLFDGDWRTADIPAKAHDTVLAATMPAYFDDASAFLARCRAWARHAVVWVVPAHAGPRGLCYAGCLPGEWHREDETPGIELVLRALPDTEHPGRTLPVDWTFSGVIDDLDRLAAYLADRLGWSSNDARRAALAAHLRLQAVPVGGGHRLAIARKSAVLVWGSP